MKRPPATIPVPPCYKLTPSMLTYLWDNCPRCFWMLARQGLYRPQMPMPSVFSKYHRMLSRYFIGQDTALLSPSLPPGRCLATEARVKSEPLWLPGCDEACYLLGRLDHLIRFDDGSWGVVDYKTIEPGAAQVARYRRQLHAYAWALERAAPDGLHLKPVTRLGLLCLDPVRLTRLAPGEEALVALRPQWIEIERNDAAFERFLGQVLRLIAEPEAPASSPQCPCCAYFARRQEISLAYC
jgi:hypothetical protein